MRAIGVVLFALLVFVVQAMLVIFAFSLVTGIGFMARVGASWIYSSLPFLSALMASAVGGYSAVKVTSIRFPDVATDVVYVSLTTLLLANAALTFMLEVSSSRQLFANASEAALFAAMTVAALLGLRLALYHVRDERSVASA